MTSLKRRAHWAGAIYLVMSICAAPALLLMPKFVVASDAAATAQRIVEGEPIYRLLVLGDLLGSILFAVLGWSLYHLFADVDRKLAGLLQALVLVSAVTGVLDAALLYAPLVLHERAAGLGAFAKPQLDGLDLMVFSIRAAELRASMMLWGLWLVPFGWLIIRSRDIPRLVGILLLIAAVGYVGMSAAQIGFPALVPLADRVGRILMQGELVVIFWLLIMGAREPKAERATS